VNSLKGKPKKKKGRRASSSAGEAADDGGDDDVSHGKILVPSKLPQPTAANKVLIKEMSKIDKNMGYKDYYSAITKFYFRVFEEFDLHPHEPPTPKFACHLVKRLFQCPWFANVVIFCDLITFINCLIGKWT